MIPVIVVALRKESVDRNYSVHIYLAGDLRVALRKESVDRNHPYMAPPYMAAASLSARRAWIEILADTLATLQNTRRSPQGERG